MFKGLRAGIDRARGIQPRLRSWVIYLIFGLKFKRFGKFSKLIGSNSIWIGDGVSVGDFCWIEAVTRYAGVIYEPNLRIGNRVALSDLTHISCIQKIVIGDDCLLGSKIYIGDHNHGSVRDHAELLSVPPARRQLGDVGEIEIGSKTWICDGAVVLAGSIIASSSIIAANSVVRLREVRPALIAGVPERSFVTSMENKEANTAATPSSRAVAPVSVGIPAYSRSGELVELLRSIYVQTTAPQEITICEDKSPEREKIRSVIEDWRERFAAQGCAINYHENAENLGFDGNIRKVIESSTTPWVILMGNDDLMLPSCVEKIQSYLARNPKQAVVSRSFVRFDRSIDEPVGISRNDVQDQVYQASTSSSKMIFRTCGFIGALIISREWATTLSSDTYDGTLYYQIYLACIAFCESGIGYISEPIVGARGGNAPLFGAAASEKGIHVPGSYSPKGRAKMWASVLRIARDIGSQFHVDLESDLKKELEVRQSFHVFEMYAGADQSILRGMRDELVKLDLFNHPVPRSLYFINLIFGSHARILYVITRKFMQSR